MLIFAAAQVARTQATWTQTQQPGGHILAISEVGEIGGHCTAMSLDRRADSQPIEPAIVRAAWARL
jgi:hypothetical protein